MSNQDHISRLSNELSSSIQRIKILEKRDPFAAEQTRAMLMVAECMLYLASVLGNMDSGPEKVDIKQIEQ